MAYGTLALSAAATGPTEIIENEKNGLMVPVRYGAALAAGMRRLLEDSALCERLRQQADQDVRGKSVDVMVEETKPATPKK